MSFQYKYNRTLLPFSKSLRTEQTDAERLLWRHLRSRQLNGYKFRRQYPIHNFILDFYCDEKMLAVELDGSQHMQRKYYDDKREKALQQLGIKILRFWDNDVLVNTSGVLEQIQLELEALPVKNPHPDPLPKERENR